MLNRQYVLGFATDAGSRTSHTAIMARSLGIPAIVGLHDVSTRLEPGADVLLDGYHGLLVLNPSEQTLREYEELERRKARVEAGLVDLRETASTTARRPPSHPLGEHRTARGHPAGQNQRRGRASACTGRSFFISTKPSLPDEEEQYANYRQVASEVLPHPIIIRTLDLGGDKVIGNCTLPTELNPFLGCRAIRFCLEAPEIFKMQLRAILRASALGNVKLMYPLISGMEEVRQANRLLDECKAELRAEGKEFNEEMDVGIMIEVPSAALCARGTGARGRVFQHRHERPDPILHRRGPGERTHRASLRADAPRHSAPDQDGRGRRARRGHLGGGLRRDGQRGRADAAAAGPGRG